MKLLLITDSKEPEQNISLILRARWPNVNLVCAEPSQAVDLAQTEPLDIAILDLDLTNGFDLLSQIRQISPIPIIALSGSTNVMDKVSALETGADHWISKPFIPVELLATLRVVLRRCGLPSFSTDKLTINFDTHEVWVSGKQVSLTPKEYDILCYLIRNEGKVVTHRSLLDSVWGPEYTADIGFLKRYIYRLRCKLEDDDDDPQMLVNQRSVGYRFVRPLR